MPGSSTNKKGNKKIGRGSGKKSHIRYNMTWRYEENKERRRLKHEKRMEYFRKRREGE